MKERVFAALLPLCLLLTLLPVRAAAAGDGSSAERPLEATLGNGGIAYEISEDRETLTILGISASWLTSNGASEETPLYVEALCDDGQYYEHIHIAADAFYQESEAPLYFLVGVTLDERTDEIGANAFRNCTSLQYIYEGENPYRHPNVKFELPGQLGTIGDYAFYNCFAEDVETAVTIPGVVDKIGAYAFGNDIDRPVTVAQIVVRRAINRIADYKSSCFSFNGKSDDRMIILKDYNSWNNIVNDSWNDFNFPQNVKNVCTYPVTVQFGTSGQTQKKLLNYSLLYEEDSKATNYYWFLNPDYELPEPPPPEGEPDPGYAYGWVLNGEVLTETSILNVNSSSVTVQADTVLQRPEISVTVNGEPQSVSKVKVTLSGNDDDTVGLQVTHPLAKENMGENASEYVYFLYRWWDEQGGSVSGDRTDSEPDLFDDYPIRKEEEIQDLAIDASEIPITDTDHTRTDGDYYMVEVFGFHVKDDQEELFYKSHRNFISFITDEDVLATVPTVYLIQVEVEEAPDYTISASPAALDFGSAQVGYAPPEAKPVTITNNGNRQVTIHLPALAGYTVTAGAEWTDGTITLAPGGQATFTVQPNAGLSEGNHNGTITVKTENGTSTEIEVSFTVTAVPAPDPAPNPGGDTSGGGNDDHDSDPYLRFDSNGGTAFASIKADEPFSLNPYEDDRYGAHIPTRSGYRFTGWYRDSRLTMRVDEDETLKIRGAVTLFAGWAETTVPDLLNGDDHFAYLQGYADGTIRPNASITRAQVATIFFRLLDEDIRDDYLTAGNPFPDVSEDYWANTAISTMAALGIVNGRSDGSFDPDASITRAEFAAICARFDEGGVSGASAFTDTSGHWAEAEIGRAAALGWVQGYSDGSFRPGQYITRAQAVTMINRMLCRQPETAQDLLPGMSTWTDCREGDWYYLAVQEAANSHGFVAKDRTYETWTSLDRAPDWSRYE